MLRGDEEIADSTRKRNRAYVELRAAIKRGEVVVPDACENCGGRPDDLRRNITGKKVGPLQAAHYNYEHPLDVRWLCRFCHANWDPAKRRGEFSTERPLMELLGFVETRERVEERLRKRTGEAIKNARQMSGVTQSALAAELQVSASYVSQVENGAKGVSTPQLRNIYTALNSASTGGAASGHQAEGQQDQDGKPSAKADAAKARRRHK